jgi:hypothetical protein
MAPLIPPPGSRFSAFANTLDYFMLDYAHSSFEAGLNDADFNQIIGSLLGNVAANMKSPYIFEPFHRAIRAPFDFYRWVS